MSEQPNCVVDYNAVLDGSRWNVIRVFVYRTKDFNSGQQKQPVLAPVQMHKAPKSVAVVVCLALLLLLLPLGIPFQKY